MSTSDTIRDAAYELLQLAERLDDRPIPSGLSRCWHFADALGAELRITRAKQQIAVQVVHPVRGILASRCGIQVDSICEYLWEEVQSCVELECQAAQLTRNDERADQLAHALREVA